jgi:hypothetical protein
MGQNQRREGESDRPPVPEKSLSRPTALPRLLSGIETQAGGGSGGMDKEGRKKSWFGWTRDNNT